jgi:hypothetical protein
MFVRMDRLINRRRQGDLGEASAIEWLTGIGATVLIPLGHSPHLDLVAEIRGQLIRIQVKTCVSRERRRAGEGRWQVQLATQGGNQSWSGVAKKFDRAKMDYLFVLVGDGRRWFIPSAALEVSRSIRLGGSKYAEFEISRGEPLEHLVYGDGVATLNSKRHPGEYRSGQTGCAVNALALSFAGSNPASPIVAAVPKTEVKPTRYERKLGKEGQAIVNQKRRLTIPQKAFFEAGFQNGSKVQVRAGGLGRIVVEQIELPEWARSR